MDRQAQQALWDIEDEVIERVGREAWDKVLEESTFRSQGRTIEFYRDHQGMAQWRWRQMTADEKQEAAEGRAEDLL